MRASSQPWASCGCHQQWELLGPGGSEATAGMGSLSPLLHRHVLATPSQCGQQVPIVCLGALQLAQMARALQWITRALRDSNFDSEVDAPTLGEWVSGHV